MYNGSIQQNVGEFQLDNRYYEKVIEEMQPFLDEQGFKAQENGNFKNDKREIKIAYDEARQMYTLSAADIGEEGDGELKEIEAWLFDDSKRPRTRRRSVWFHRTHRKNMGIRLKRTADGSNVELPSFSKGGALPLRASQRKCSISSRRLRMSIRIT